MVTVKVYDVITITEMVEEHIEQTVTVIGSDRDISDWRNATQWLLDRYYKDIFTDDGEHLRVDKLNEIIMGEYNNNTIREFVAADILAMWVNAGGKLLWGGEEI